MKAEFNNRSSRAPHLRRNNPIHPSHSGGHPSGEQIAREGSEGPGVLVSESCSSPPPSTGEAKPGTLCTGPDSPEHGDTGESPAKAYKNGEGTGTSPVDVPTGGMAGRAGTVQTEEKA